jgi:hypothetical protein
LRFARVVGIAPGIVVGRMQKEGLLEWNRLNHLKEKYSLGVADSNQWQPRAPTVAKWRRGSGAVSRNMGAAAPKKCARPR